MPQIKPSKKSPHGRSMGMSSKKNEGSLRSQLRAMQRSNRRYTGGSTLDGRDIRPRDERIKRNEMNMAGEHTRRLIAIDIEAFNHGVYIP